MRSLWSFWSKPFLAHRASSWTSEQHHLLAWILSLETARRHYPRTALVTDDYGARLLVDGLGLEFGEVSTALNTLHGADPGWWALGKVCAYGLQREPFIHLDTDVFLWKRLPAWLETADVVAQYAEVADTFYPFYRPEVVEAALRETGGGWLPEEWRWYRNGTRPQRGECCGLFGGSHLGFIQYYAGVARRFMEHPDNQRAWQRMANKPWHMILFEQYLLAACLEFQNRQPTTPFAGVKIRYLFNSTQEAYHTPAPAHVGFTHLLADAKKDQLLAERLARRVQRDFPNQYERCLAFVASGRHQHPMTA